MEYRKPGIPRSKSRPEDDASLALMTPGSVDRWDMPTRLQVILRAAGMSISTRLSGCERPPNMPQAPAVVKFRNSNIGCGGGAFNDRARRSRGRAPFAAPPRHNG